ncbi:MAG TPA: hypothetical protein VEO18_05975 [Thermoplasmata archaeon]|nr:hypothetical protein [Thermoplasmata archaeon]
MIYEDDAVADERRLEFSQRSIHVDVLDVPEWLDHDPGALGPTTLGIRTLIFVE